MSVADPADALARRLAHAERTKEWLRARARQAYDAGDLRNGDEITNRAREWAERCDRLYRELIEALT